MHVMDDATPDGNAKSERKTTRASASQVNGSEDLPDSGEAQCK
jgi:hypothetical protein